MGCAAHGQSRPRCPWPGSQGILQEAPLGPNATSKIIAATTTCRASTRPTSPYRDRTTAVSGRAHSELRAALGTTTPTAVDQAALHAPIAIASDVRCST